MTIAVLSKHYYYNLPVVSHKEGVRHVGKLLTVMLCVLDGRSVSICDDVIHVAGAASARISQPHDLNGCRLEGKQLVSCTFSISIHVNQNMNTISINPVSSLTIAWQTREVNEVLSLL